MAQDIRREDIHMFKYRGLKLLYDVNSGSLHQVDDLAWELINMLLGGKKKEEARGFLGRQYPADEVNEALRQVEELQAEKLLFSTAPDLEGEKLAPSGVKALCLFVSHACNFHCRYCFARREQGHVSPHMSRKVGRKAVDFLLQFEEGHFREIDFFGGEPLLNFSLVREVVEYARGKALSRGKEFNFTLTTNASLLNEEQIDFLNRENINVILSLDGRPQIHDRMRSFKNGKGSYEIAVKNSKNLLQRRGYTNYFIRGTYTKNNLDFCNDLRHMLELGFKSLSLEPVVCGPEQSYALGEEDLPLLEAEYDRLVELYLEQQKKGEPFSFYHFILDLQKGPCLYKRLSGCGAGMEYLAVTADGGLYPCHQFAGMEGFYMGNLMHEPILSFRERGAKVAAAAREREACRSCWARYLCGRGCAASSYFLAGDLRKTYDLGCALQKIRLERALYLQALEAVSD